MKNTINNIKEIIGQFKFILNRKQKISSLKVIIVIIIGAGFETIGISAILPFVQAMMSPEDLLENKIVKFVVELLDIKTVISLTILMGIGVILIYLIKNSYLALAVYIQMKFQCSLEKEISVQLLCSYMKRPYTYFLNVNSSEIIRNVESDVNGLYGMLGAILRITTEGLTALLIGLFIFSQDPLMALGIIFLAILCFGGTAYGFKKILKNNGLRNRKYAALKYKHIYQATNGIKEIKVMNRGDYFTDNYESAVGTFQKTKLVQTFIAALPEKIIETVCVSGLIGIVCFRIWNGGAAATYMSQLATFAVAAFRILPSIARITSNFNDLVYYKSFLDAVYRNLKEVRDYEKYMLDYGSNMNNSNEGSPRKFENCVELKNIYWNYQGSDKIILEDLSITIRKGQSVAFIGASGAGKTTTADIILGLLHPMRGEVLMDGVDIFTMLNRWSQIIGYVPQTVFITDDTIRNNVAFGLESELIDDKKVWEALGQAQLKAYVEGLPQKLETELGERGTRFSGGQKQRIAIARALYYNPDILVLDEATAALDNETEAALMESIEILQGKKTLIIVAHRLTTIKNCDKVYEVADGKAMLYKEKELNS